MEDYYLTVSQIRSSPIKRPLRSRSRLNDEFRHGCNNCVQKFRPKYSRENSAANVGARVCAAEAFMRNFVPHKSGRLSSCWWMRRARAMLLCCRNGAFDSHRPNYRFRNCFATEAALISLFFSLSLCFSLVSHRPMRE